MLIVYHGHSCFEIKGDFEPKSIVFDPFSKNTGDLELKVRADVALCTHDHFDHNNCGVGSIKLKEFLGTRQIGSAIIRGVKLFHDEKKGALRGVISAYVVKYVNTVLIHLGDLGHIPEQKQMEELLSLGRPDILFVPVGGVYTIDPKQAVKVIELLNPRVAIPMHYKHPKLNPRIFSRLHTLEDFLNVWKGEVVRAGSNVWEVPAELWDETKVVVLEYP